MCFNLVTYKEWRCGWRENTGRHNNIDCGRPICPLSKCHKAEQHDCKRSCEGTQTEDRHLVMSTLGTICTQCREAGRGPGEHPGIGGGPKVDYLIANYGPTPGAW